jgi:hypothetical protein
MFGCPIHDDGFIVGMGGNEDALAPEIGPDFSPGIQAQQRTGL